MKFEPSFFWHVWRGAAYGTLIGLLLILLWMIEH